jgi:hypothetical protein
MKKCEFLGLAVLVVSAFSGCATRNTRPPVIPSAQEAGSPALLGSRGSEETPQLIEQSRALPTTSGGELNAAESYQQAMALYDAMPSDRKFPSEQMDEVGEKQLCDEIAPIIKLMREAAAVTNCDWGIANAPQGATYAFGPYLHKCRDLGRVTIWSAAHCHQDNVAETADELVLILQFITHRVRQDFLMCFLVTASVHNMTAACIAENAWRFSDTDKARLVQALNDPQFEENLYLAIDQDANRILEEAAKVKSNLTAEVGQPTADQLLTLAKIREPGELEKKFVTVLNQDESDYQAWLDEMRIARASNPYIEPMWDRTEKAVNLGRATLIRHAMVTAGFAVLQFGTTALSNYPDPATGKPFGYQEDADEFQLESGFQLRGEPITMIFRRRDDAEVDAP